MQEETTQYPIDSRCKDCEFRNECFNNQDCSRRILRWEKEGIVDKMKTKETRAELKKRKGIIEPVFGIVKRCFGFEYVLFFCHADSVPLVLPLVLASCLASVLSCKFL